MYGGEQLEAEQRVYIYVQQNLPQSPRGGWLGDVGSRKL